MRLVTATNRVLRDEIAAGRFREDLYFRLNVIPIQLVPLRERRDDVIPLARHFLARHAAEAGRRLALSPEAEEVLRGHAWAGNVRELENAIERAVVLARGTTITPEDMLLEAVEEQRNKLADGTLQDRLTRPPRRASAALARPAASARPPRARSASTALHPIGSCDVWAFEAPAAAAAATSQNPPHFPLTRGKIGRIAPWAGVAHRRRIARGSVMAV